MVYNHCNSTCNYIHKLSKNPTLVQQFLKLPENLEQLVFAKWWFGTGKYKENSETSLPLSSFHSSPVSFWCPCPYPTSPTCCWWPFLFFLPTFLRNILFQLPRGENDPTTKLINGVLKLIIYLNSYFFLKKRKYLSP